jgi:hypothetical protein
MAAVKLSDKVPSVSPFLHALRADLDAGRGKTQVKFEVGDLRVEVRTTNDSLWALIRRDGSGGLALRAAYLPVPFDCTVIEPHDDEAARLVLKSALGQHDVVFKAKRDELERLRMTASFTPSVPILMPFVPRDLCPLDNNDDPLGTQGNIEAGQRGVNAGLLYFHLDEPAFGNVLYLQNLTALNDYCLATQTKPDGIVGGTWPELGMLLPTLLEDGTTASEPLKPGIQVALSDAILIFRNDAPLDERASARHFIQLLGAAYEMIDQPPTQCRDWIGRAERTLKDLKTAPEATIRHYGHRYIHPYTDAEYPDSMVQLSVLSAIHDWGKWQGKPDPLEAELAAGLSKFYDPKLGTMRRYLPNVGSDKNADAVDSWYLYHPMLNLANLALDGDQSARKLFVKSLDYGIKAAHHFKYQWPIQYNVQDFSVITLDAPADGRGQTDVGGIYAWVMLQAFELTDDKRYLDEARAALDAAMGLRFNVNYQANLTAWGAAACMRMWRITNRDLYLDLSYVYLASFFHNAVIWESELGHAVNYSTFLGVTCMQDAPYMAIYECFDSYAALERYLDDSGPDLEPAARMLVSEYCKYALTRAWSYYPDALPARAVADKQRENNGHVDRKLSFPVEDLYPDGQQAGQVGQEIYGSGAAFIFATRIYHRIEDAPFLLRCDHFIRAMERTGDKALSISLDGGETCLAELSIVRRKRCRLPKMQVATAGGDFLRPRTSSTDRISYHVPANGRLILTWE